MASGRALGPRLRSSGLAAFALLSIACGESEIDRRDLNVVWVVLDAYGARHFVGGGAGGSPSPQLEALARESVHFRRAYAQWPSTLGSTASFITGRYPPPEERAGSLVEEGLATWLREAGLRTAAFSENPFVSAAWGFKREFGELHYNAPIGVEHSWRVATQRNTARTVTEGLRWIDRGAGRPFFLYLHLLPPHAPYTPPAPFRGRFSSVPYDGPFDGGIELLVDVFEGRRSIGKDDLAQLVRLYRDNIAYVDHQLGGLVAALANRGLLAHTLLIVSSDHGEAFGEHGDIMHGTSLYEEQLHVPLVMRLPDRFGVRPRQVDALVELVDIVPTVLDVLGQPPREGAGRSLLPLLRGEEPHEDLHYARAWAVVDEGKMAAVITDRSKLIDEGGSRGARLYDLAADPGELNDISGARHGLAGELASKLRFTSRPFSSASTTIDRQTEEQLKALGYFDEASAGAAP